MQNISPRMFDTEVELRFREEARFLDCSLRLSAARTIPGSTSYKTAAKRGKLEKSHGT